MSRWLYKTEFVTFLRVPEKLLAYGKQGWELVSVIPHFGEPTRYDLIFKKPDSRLTPLEEAIRKEETENS